MILTIRSSAFADGQAIPRRHTEDGEDLSPPLSWPALSGEIKELVLIVDDPDAPSDEPWVHWVIYKIPASLQGLEEGVTQNFIPVVLNGAVQGKNSWRTIGYRGPAPPPGDGLHHYHFKLYALDAELDLKPGMEKHDLMNEMSGHVLGHGELVGTYQR